MKRNLFDTSIVKIFSLVGALAFNWLISLYLNTEDSDRMFTVLAVTPGLAVLLSFGADQTVLKFGSADFATRGRPGLLATVSAIAHVIVRRATIMLGLGTVALALCYSLGRVNLSQIAPWLFAGLLAPFFAGLLSVSVSLRIQGRYAFSVLAEPSAVMMLSAAFFYLASRIIHPSFALVLGIYAAILIAMSSRFFLSLRAKEAATIKHDVEFGLAQVAQYMIQWGVIAQISLYSSSAHISILSLALRAVFAVNFVLIVVNTVNGHKIAKTIQSGETADLIDLLRKQTSYLVVFGLINSILLAVAAPYIFSILGPEYKEATNVTRILILGQLVNVLVGPAFIMLNMSGHSRQVRILTVSIGALVTALVWPFYEFGGIQGVASLMALSLVANSLIAGVLASKLCGVRPIWPTER